MWNALKSDLFDFVQTIQEDTSKTLSLVLGDEEEEVISLCIWHQKCFIYFFKRRSTKKIYWPNGSLIPNDHMKLMQM
jgi:hypothetical protein